ncbi:hypothetical protein RRG08_047249 [Elysia crispata]|uniref:PiggyBac transposable element-derived protein domain-containing protein n=1 Tax=Elysia crispata TaxID=231223 RepID=A0AAE1A316_9GAST|nr:hypothetical protein RRG08_047249 [Elysia crispata]
MYIFTVPPIRPDKYGIKIFWICDSENGFPLHGDPYLGRNGQKRETNVGRNTAIALASPYFGSGRNLTLVTVDNFFTDMELSAHLLEHCICRLCKVNPSVKLSDEDRRALFIITVAKALVRPQLERKQVMKNLSIHLKFTINTQHKLKLERSLPLTTESVTPSAMPRLSNNCVKISSMLDLLGSVIVTHGVTKNYEIFSSTKSVFI